MSIVEIKDLSFDEYKNLFEKLIKQNDIREIRFQNEVIAPFIKSICDFDIVDSSHKERDSGKHDYLQYCGTYTDNKTGLKKPSTPDLTIAKNWNWHNIDNAVDYRAVVEVKSPYLAPIYHKNFDMYNSALKNELKRHLTATKNEKLILTDCLKWEFYYKINDLTPIKEFRLYDLFQRGEWKWKTNEKFVINDNTIKEPFHDNLNNEKPIEIFENLKMFLIVFLQR